MAAPIWIILISLIALGALLARTAAWWVLGALLIAGAVATLASIKPVDGGVGGIGALSNIVSALTTIVLGGLGALSLALSGVVRIHVLDRRASLPVTLPAARIIQR